MNKSVKYPLLITEEIVKVAKEKNILCGQYLEIGKYVCVNVLKAGYSIPHTASVIDNLEYAQKACDAHNKSLGLNKKQADIIIYKSMNTSLNL